MSCHIRPALHVKHRPALRRHRVVSSMLPGPCAVTSSPECSVHTATEEDCHPDEGTCSASQIVIMRQCVSSVLHGCLT